MAAGTAAAVVPIRSITRRSTGEKLEFGSGPLCLELLTRLRKIQRGETSEEFAEWVEAVKAPETVYEKYAVAKKISNGVANGVSNGVANGVH